MTGRKENDGSGKRSEWGVWSHLDKETREQYEAIEDRVREKVRKGLL